MNREQAAARAQPSGNGVRVKVSVRRRDGTEEGVFEDPVVGHGSGVAKEIALVEGSWESFRGGFFGGKAHGRRGDIEPERQEAMTGPGSGVVTGATARDQHASSGKIGSVAEKVGEAG